jgi:hypothetical protein
MHHRFHDEPEWHVDSQRDELDSIISGNYNEMEDKYREEFHGVSARRKRGYVEETNKPNIFHGNFY